MYMGRTHYPAYGWWYGHWTQRTASSLIATLALSVPNRKPSGRMTAARPFSFSRYIITDMNRSAVSLLAKVSRKMVLNFRLFRPTIGRIHQDNVYLIVLGIVQNISEKCVIMEHLRHIHIMQQHISDAKNIRKTVSFQLRKWNYYTGSRQLLFEFFDAKLSASW